MTNIDRHPGQYAAHGDPALAHATSPALAPPTFPGRLGLSVDEFAAAVGISRTSAYLAVQRGEVPSKAIGRRRIIPLAALQAWLARS